MDRRPASAWSGPSLTGRSTPRSWRRPCAWRYEVRCLAIGSANVQYGNIRDQGMAENITFLLERLYPGRKIVVWAHNFHIQHDGPELSEGNYNMGSYLVQRHRDELYSVGLFMYWGQAAMNDRSVV